MTITVSQRDPACQRVPYGPVRARPHLPPGHRRDRSPSRSTSRSSGPRECARSCSSRGRAAPPSPASADPTGSRASGSLPVAAPGVPETHIAFAAPDRAAVDAVHAAAVEAGVEVLHGPREFPEYHPGYYGVFVRDPDGNNVEAVSTTAEPRNCFGTGCEHVFVSDRGRSSTPILHADLDAFYASVEQRDDPRLRGRPVIVGGGVVLAASYEAKALRRAHGDGRAPGAGACARRRSSCRRGCRPTPRRARRCSRCSDDTTPLVEGISIDEAFLDVGGLRADRGHAGRDRGAAAGDGARAGRPADHGRRGAHEVPREGRERGRQARRAAGRAARRRAGVPAPAAGRAAVGRRAR